MGGKQHPITSLETQLRTQIDLPRSTLNTISRHKASPKAGFLCQLSTVLGIKN